MFKQHGCVRVYMQQVEKVPQRRVPRVFAGLDTVRVKMHHLQQRPQIQLATGRRDFYDDSRSALRAHHEICVLGLFARPVRRAARGFRGDRIADRVHTRFTQAGLRDRRADRPPRVPGDSRALRIKTTVALFCVGCFTKIPRSFTGH